MSCSICVAASPWLGVPSFSIRSSCFWDLSFICVVALGSTRKYNLHDSCGSIIAYRAAPKDFIVFSFYYIHNVRVKLSYHDTDVAIFLFPDSSPSLHFSLARNKTSEISKIISHVFPKNSHVFSKISHVFS